MKRRIVVESMQVLMLLHCMPWHAGSSMICRFEGCVRSASYGAPGTRSRIACTLHKAAHHVYLIGNRCDFGNGTATQCRSRGVYGIAGKPMRWCRMHRQAGTVHLLSRKCRDTACAKQPIFGVANTTLPLYCRQHKGDDHVDVVNRRCQMCNRQVTLMKGTCPGSAEGRRTRLSTRLTLAQRTSANHSDKNSAPSGGILSRLVPSRN
jgi:hypothetical protein